MNEDHVDSSTKSVSNFLPVMSSHIYLKPWNGSRIIRTPILVAYSILVLVALTFMFREYGANRSSPVEQHGHPTVELMNGTDLIWQVPDSPKAVLFLAHGCSGKAANFWDRSPRCPNCVGLPEERLIVLQALYRKFAILAISSVGKCWSFGEESFVVEWMIKWWVKQHGLQKIPLVGLGASSGGYFLSSLAARMKFSSIVLMIAEGMFNQLDVGKEYPPTLFVHMPKDETRKQRIDENLQALRTKGIDVGEIKCSEFPLSPNFLSERIPGLDYAIAAKLYTFFQGKGFIDKNGYMTNDGRAIRWKQALRGEQSVRLHKSLFGHIQEEMNLAFAYHEMTSMQTEQIFNWFESHFS